MFEFPFAARMICMAVGGFKDVTRYLWYRDCGYTFVYDYIKVFLRQRVLWGIGSRIKGQIYPLNRDNNNRDESDQRD